MLIFIIDCFMIFRSSSAVPNASFYQYAAFLNDIACLGRRTAQSSKHQCARRQYAEDTIAFINGMQMGVAVPSSCGTFDFYDAHDALNFDLNYDAGIISLWLCETTIWLNTASFLH